MQNLNTKSIESLSHTLGLHLLAQGQKVASVESCTGGGLAFAITEVAGSSQWFEKSWVTYSNQAKHEEVDVSLKTLAAHGAVSSQVVIEMAQGGLRKSGADLCISISGIAGPDGGTASKPVGLVWFAIVTAKHSRSFSRCFSGNRYQVRQQAISLALTELVESLVNT